MALVDDVVLVILLLKISMVIAASMFSVDVKASSPTFYGLASAIMGAQLAREGFLIERQTTIKTLAVTVAGALAMVFLVDALSRFSGVGGLF